MTEVLVPFSRPPHTDADVERARRVMRSDRVEGGGVETKACQKWLESRVGCRKALLTTSCTAALEMACLLLDLKPGDEVILPSFTFSSSANAIALRGAVPVFVDSRDDNLNMDETKVAAAVTSRTRAVMPVHYAGVGCEMDSLMKVANQHGLVVIEDAAQGICADYREAPLGGIGAMGAFSFHVSKNISCGEGGALLINDEKYVERAEILWEKGTNRAQFLRGEVDKYTWRDLGSSFLPSEILAAILITQLDRADEITATRLRLWNRYHDALAGLEEEGLLRRPRISNGCRHNAHIYYVLLRSEAERNRVIGVLRERGINTQFHYVPLHSAPAGRRYGRVAGSMDVVDDLSGRLLRLPLYPDMSAAQEELVITNLERAVRASS